MIIDINADLKDEERNLLSIAYKNAIGQRRTAWRSITAYELKEESEKQAPVEWYKKHFEEEL